MGEFTSLLAKEAFIGIGDCTYLYTGAEAPILHAGRDALMTYASAKSRAAAGREEQLEMERRCRDQIARLLGAGPGDIAMLSSASEAINSIANGIDWQLGDNVVVNDIEYPSVVFPWLKQRPHGVEVRVVHHRGWRVETNDLIAAIDERTRVVAVSHVSFLSGFRHDLRVLSEAAHRVGALFVVDATQSLGVVPVDGKLCDFVVASSYKWMLGTHGAAVLYWNREAVPDFVPASVGWWSVESIFLSDRYRDYHLKSDAERFIVGYPCMPTIYVLEHSVSRLLQVGIDAIEAHVLALGQKLIAGLTDQGWTVMTSAAEHERAGNIAFVASEPEGLAATLAQDDVHVWGGDDRIRISIHLFNDEHDIERLLAALSPYAPVITSAR